jgi:beta-phosphoglucomutase-like phosphatase (HAD superfamily)
MVIEDSEIGLKAAKAAGMKCIVTTSSYTAGEDFQGADRVIAELGDGPGALAFEDIRALALKAEGVGR